MLVPVLPGWPAVTLRHGTSSLSSDGAVTFGCGPVTSIVLDAPVQNVAVVRFAVLSSCRVSDTTAISSRLKFSPGMITRTRPGGRRDVTRVLWPRPA